MENKKVNMNIYGQVYDNFTKYKPSYHQIHDLTSETLSKYLDKVKNPIIGDFGAGTAEQVVRLLNKIPDVNIYAIEINPSFLEQSIKKVGKHDNAVLIQGDIEKPLFPDNSLDGVSMIHVLNYTSHPREYLCVQRAYDALKPGGILVCADIGRILNMKEHKKEIITEIRKDLGLVGMLMFLYKSREVIRQNKIFRQNQGTVHPLHSLDEFVTNIESIGFNILEKRDDLYLGDDDYVVAQKLS